MSDNDLKRLACELKEMLLGQTQAIKCGMSDSIVQEHTKVLATLQSDVSHILSGIVDINDKLEKQTENHNENTDRITKLETRESTKKDYLATLLSILAVVVSIAVPFANKIAKLFI